MNTQLPTEISTLSDEELTETLDSLIAEFDELHDAGSTDIATLTEIAEAVDVVRAEIGAREEAASAAAEAVAALRDRLHPVADSDPEDDESDSDEVPEVEIIEAEAEPVLASSKPAPKAPSARAIRRMAPKVEAPAAEPMLTITAAADVPGLPTGATIDMLQLAKGMHDKARALSNGSPRVPVARFNIPNQFKVGADLAHNLDVLEQVRNPQSLVAAGGWCAPSTTMYDLLGIEAGDGLIDLPTVQVTRGGLNVPGFLDISDAADALWTWTEADDEAAHDPSSPTGEKPCLRIPCPEFTDYRLVAEGLCITNGNLTDRAFPELTARFIALAVNAHLHRLSAAIIADIIAGSTAVTVAGPSSSAAGELLNAIDLQVADYRSQYRMSTNAVLEAVFPLWAREIVRADLAMRSGVDLLRVTDADVEAYFAVRKVRPQFVHDYQPLYNAAAATAWPATMDFLLYPAGGFVRGDGGAIDLGVVRDSVLNATNDYTAAWTEQLYLVAQMGPKAREVTVNLAVSGATGCCETPAT